MTWDRRLPGLVWNWLIHRYSLFVPKAIVAHKPNHKTGSRSRRRWFIFPLRFWHRSKFPLKPWSKIHNFVSPLTFSSSTRFYYIDSTEKVPKMIGFTTGRHQSFQKRSSLCLEIGLIDFSYRWDRMFSKKETVYVVKMPERTFTIGFIETLNFLGSATKGNRVDAKNPENL